MLTCAITHDSCFALADMHNQLAASEATIKELNERIATLLEAHASVPTRDVSGTIKAQANRIRNQEAIIKQYRQEMKVLQSKVDEQDVLLKGLTIDGNANPF